jgi:hypothetical protein
MLPRAVSRESGSGHDNSSEINRLSVFGGLKRALDPISDRPKRLLRSNLGTYLAVIVLAGKDLLWSDPTTHCGVNLAYVKDQLGHSSIKLTVDVYGHSVPGANRDALDRLPVIRKKVLCTDQGSHRRPGRFSPDLAPLCPLMPSNVTF